MRRSMRVLASAILAITGIGGVILALLSVPRGPVHEPSPPLAADPEPIAQESRVLPAVPVSTGEEEMPATQVTSTPPAEPEEKPIEEILAEAGEDPGAVYFASRVREAIKEGNPTFARELLRQMKEAHPDSVLVEEAESFFKTTR
jgi:hypothetical protein